MLGGIHSELDSLSREWAGKSGGQDGASADSPVPVAVKEKEGPILAELLSDRQRALARASSSIFRRTAVGYTVDPNVSLGMNFVNWFGPWGAKMEATVRMSSDWRLAGMNLSLLRSLHRFSVFEGLQTHLYAFTGLGGYWQRMDIYGTEFVTFPVNRKWFESPDITGNIKMGVGSELGFYALGGVQFTPEIGLLAARFFSRHQDSDTWKLQSLTPADQPKSDYSLDAYFGLHLNFYFR